MAKELTPAHRFQQLEAELHSRLFALGLVAHGASVAPVVVGSGISRKGMATSPIWNWIDQASSLLAGVGIWLNAANRKDLYTVIMHESAGDPKAVNHWDANAKAGHPSEGLMQTIQPTFAAYHLQGHGDIFDPVDNIAAGVRYALDRYGSLANLPGLVSLRRGGSYVGY
ncbi:MAG: transglycosylase SLT domain-containing protein [Cyanobacteria bacterium REEB65]|nr:transglycosylase SLT domain-containing protein [Cyanobacteria bacterium REEB65]